MRRPAARAAPRRYKGNTRPNPRLGREDTDLPGMGRPMPPDTQEETTPLFDLRRGGHVERHGEEGGRVPSGGTRSARDRMRSEACTILRRKNLRVTALLSPSEARRRKEKRGGGVSRSVCPALKHSRPEKAVQELETMGHGIDPTHDLNLRGRKVIPTGGKGYLLVEPEEIFRGAVETQRWRGSSPGAKIKG